MVVLIEEVVSLLRDYDLVKKIRIVHYDETPTGHVAAKIRCRLAKRYQFQVWLNGKPGTIDYAYQLFSNRPILRWDNSPHYPKIPTFPHHFHDENGDTRKSRLSGRTLNDLKLVLAEIEKWIDKESSPSRKG